MRIDLLHPGGELGVDTTDVRFVSRLPVEHDVVIDLVRTHHDQPAGVLYLDPGSVRRAVVIVPEGLRLRPQVQGELRGIGVVGRQLELGGRRFKPVLVGQVVGHDLEAVAVGQELLGLDDRVGALDLLLHLVVEPVGPGLDGLLGHVGRVEGPPFGPAVVHPELDEGLMRPTVVATVVQHNVVAQGLVVVGLHARHTTHVAELLAVDRVLVPVDVVQDVGRGHEVRQALHLLGAETAQVRRHLDAHELGVHALQLFKGRHLETHVRVSGRLDVLGQ